MPQKTKTISTVIILALIILLGASLRFNHLNWDEGHHLHPDERFLTMVTTDIDWPGSIGEYFASDRSSLSPYNRGKNFFVYGTFPVFLTKLVGDLTGLRGYDGYPLAGRALSALFDLMTILVVFLIGRSLFNTRTGLLSAFLLAITVLHIQHAHYFVVDPFASFFLTLSFYLLTRLVKRPHWANFAWVGCTFGMALACKVSAIFFAPIIVLGCLIIVFKDSREGTLKKFWSVFAGGMLTALTTLLLFRIFQPYAFAGPYIWNLGLAPEFMSSMNQLRSLSGTKSTFPPGVQWIGRSVFFQIKNLTLWGFGLPLSVLSWLGLSLGTILLAAKRDKRFMLIVPWILLILGYQAVQFAKPMRYLLPITPLLVILAAFFLNALLSGFPTKSQKKIEKRTQYALWATGTTFILASLFWAVAFANIYTRSITRIDASKWIYQNVPANSTIANEHWDRDLPLRLKGAPHKSFRYEKLALFNRDTPKKIQKISEQLSRTDYIVLSSDKVYRCIPRVPKRYPMTSRYYALLFNGSLGFDQIKPFTSNPSFLGLEIDDSAAEESFTYYEHPKVIIFKKTKSLSAAEIFNQIIPPKK